MKLMSDHDVADALEMHVETVRSKARNGQLPMFKLNGRWKIKQEVLQSLIDRLQKEALRRTEQRTEQE